MIRWVVFVCLVASVAACKKNSLSTSKGAPGFGSIPYERTLVRVLDLETEQLFPMEPACGESGEDLRWYARIPADLEAMSRVDQFGVPEKPASLPLIYLARTRTKQFLEFRYYGITVENLLYSASKGQGKALGIDIGHPTALDSFKGNLATMTPWSFPFDGRFPPESSLEFDCGRVLATFEAESGPSKQ